ncbi:MAG: alpha/beta hydrolase [Eubacterium sp.]|nr:alpha/beta hydrolase [Eubacterium sp.]
MKQNQTFLSSDGITTIHAVEWTPEDKPKAVVQLIHGMVEYIERYDDFANYLTSQGFVVVGHDHLGHGQSVRSIEDWGYICDIAPARALIRDIHKLRKLTSKKYPDIPYFILGHSMGSYLLRRYLSHKGEGLAGAIIVGTGSESDIVTRSGLMLVRSTAQSKGWHFRSEKIRNMTYGAAYKKFDTEGVDPEGSWICSVPEIMEKYNNDARCQFTFTLNGYEALLSTVLYVNQKQNIEHIPNELPLLITSGEQDPVGNLGKGVKKVYQQYVKSGIEDIECKLYPEDRHEILNEFNKEEVYADIQDWIERHMIKEEETVPSAD